MEFAIWAYPWDILDVGVDDALERLAEIGIDEINLATTYHSVHSFAPTNPDRRSYFARASAYFQPEAEYTDLAPVTAEAMGDADWVSEIGEAVSDSPLSLNAWTVGCHNSRLGLARPELTITSPHGDSLPFGLCPSQPAVGSYLTTLVRDLGGRDLFERIELETFDYFFGSGLGWHHDKVFVDLGKLGIFLLGLCFCDACRANATAAGVDVSAAREACVSAIDDVVTGRLPSSLDPLAWVRTRPSVAAYVDVRERTLVDLFARLRAATDAELGYYVGILDVGDEWLFGADLPSLADHVDYFTVVAYESSADAVTNRVYAANELTADAPVHAGIQPGPPVLEDGETVSGIVDAVAETGTERVSFYNYGPLPERSLGWIDEAIGRDR